jgi:hypothetical protein
MLGGTCEFPDDFILLRNRHLPLISCALMLEGRATPRHFRGKRHDRRALLDCEAQWLSLLPARRFPPRQFRAINYLLPVHPLGN